MAETEKKLLRVYSIREYTKDSEKKTMWQQVGVGFVNKDDSYNIKLNFLPLPNKDTGTIDLHMRFPSEQGGNVNVQHWDEELF